MNENSNKKLTIAMIKTWSTLKNWADFRGLVMKNPLKKRLKSLQKVEVYLEPMLTYTMELFCKYT